MRRWVYSALTSGLSACLLLSGCAQMVDIDQKALIVGMSLDSGSSPNTNVVGLQYIVPSSGQGGGGGGPSVGGGGSTASGQGVSICDEGTSVGAALIGLRHETERYLYFGNLGVAVIGESLAKQGVLPDLDFLMRDGTVSESLQLVVVRGPACRLLQNTTPSSQASALSLFLYMRDAEYMTYPVSPNVLWRFMASSYSPAASGYMPIVTTSQQGAPFHVEGIAIFLHDRMVGEFDGYGDEPVDWLVKRGGFPDALINLPGMPQPVDLRFEGVRRRIQVLSGHEVGISFNISAFVRQAPGLVLGSGDLSGLESLASGQIQQQIRGVLRQLQAERADVIGLDDHVLAHYPGEAPNWPAVFSHMKITLKVDVRILSGGRLT